MADDLATRMRKELKQANEARKSDDIVQFMRDKWSLFCSSKRMMDSICEELEQQGELTPTGLSEALDIDPAVMFRKSKLTESAEAVLDYPKSAVCKAFEKTVEKQRLHGVEQDLCLLVVAGARTIVVTNIEPRPVEGTWHMTYVNAKGRDVYVFKAEQLQARLPTIFSKG